MEQIRMFFSDPLVGRLLRVAIGLIVMIIVMRIFNRGLNRYVKTNSTRYSARKLGGFLTFFIFAVFVMITFSYKISNITLALGMAGAGIAFALQEVIVSIAGFLAVLFGNFYKVGDRVQFGGIKGDVVDIGVLRTTLMEIGDWVNGDLYNGKMVRVANSFIFKEPVSNYSGDFPFLWDEIKVPLKHSCDVAYAREKFLVLMTTELGDYSKNSREAWQKLTTDLYIENAQIDPMVTLTFDENWIVFTLRYVVDFKKRRGTKDILFTKILALVKESNGKMQIASSALEITNIS